MSLSRLFYIRRHSSTSSAQICRKFSVAESTCSHFIRLEVLFGAFEYFPICSNLKLLREKSDLKVKHANLMNGLSSHFLGGQVSALLHGHTAKIAETTKKRIIFFLQTSFDVFRCLKV